MKPDRIITIAQKGELIYTYKTFIILEHRARQSYREISGKIQR
jgi:hypothetical protein